MKNFNFNVEDISITFGELLKWFEDRKKIVIDGKAAVVFFADLLRKIFEEDEYNENDDANRFSTYMTARFAVGNDYKYPETDEDAEVQSLLCFVSSGAFYLIVERLEEAAERSLNDAERFILAGLLHELTYERYAENHPELKEERQEEQE